MSINVRKNRARNVFTIPCWVSLVVVMRGRLVEVSALGPVFSSQVWSTICPAMACPKIRFILGSRRCMIIGK